MGYDYNAPLDERRKAYLAWRDWLQKSKAYLGWRDWVRKQRSHFIPSKHSAAS
jgi:hypothetical protein